VNDIHHDVVIKQLKNSASTEKELTILQHLPCHTNLVRYLGSDPRGMLFQRECGSILLMVEQLKSSPQLLKSLLVQVLNGLLALAAAGIAHLDLSAGNILYSLNRDQYTFRICDFGCSSFYGTRLTSSDVPFAMFEELRMNGVTEKSDVFNFGNLLLSLSNNRPDWIDLVDQCQSPDLENRPTLADLLHILQIKPDSFYTRYVLPVLENKSYVDTAFEL